jgi:ABC-2 type transport system ATP-binding protein
LSFAIETINLTKRFLEPKGYRHLLLHPFRKNEMTVLKDVNIHVKKGELFGLLGPNGAGKTTLIKILCTLILPNEGTAFVNGHDIKKDGKAVRKSIGYVIGEERSFYWRLTGRQNLKFFATLNNLASREADDRIEELVKLTGLKDDIDKLFKNYSSGLKQRLAIARGLLTDPDILFLDEPTKGLDPLAANDLNIFIRNWMTAEKKKTIVLATHNMQEAEKLCDRIAMIHQGRIKICETLKEIRKTLDQKARYILGLLGTLEYSRQTLLNILPQNRIELLSSKRSCDNGLLFRVQINNEKEHISDVVEKIVTAGIKVEACYPEELSLNEAFAKIVG